MLVQRKIVCAAEHLSREQPEVGVSVSFSVVIIAVSSVKNPREHGNRGPNIVIRFSVRNTVKIFFFLVVAVEETVNFVC